MIKGKHEVSFGVKDKSGKTVLRHIEAYHGETYEQALARESKERGMTEAAIIEFYSDENQDSDDEPLPDDITDSVMKNIDRAFAEHDSQNAEGDVVMEGVDYTVNSDGNYVYNPGTKWEKILTPKQRENMHKSYRGALIGVVTSDNVTIKDVAEHALDRMIGRGYGPSEIIGSLKMGKAFPGNKPGRTIYQKRFARAVVSVKDGVIISVIRRVKLMQEYFDPNINWDKDVDLDKLGSNYQESVNMEFISLEAPLEEVLATFVKEQFGITDVDALSSEEYSEFYDKLCDIEVDTSFEAHENGTPLSEYGHKVAGVVTYMGNQFIEGGKRWEGIE